IIRQV
ncbi:haloacid dehalogenase-like hydrolase family protein, partial [Vibrio parahaemolyticus V-223/04]